MSRKTIQSMAFFSPRAIAAAATPPDTLTTTLFVTNLHCTSCVTHAQDTIKPLPGIFKVDVNLLSHTICVQHEPGLTSNIADVLLDAAFEVRHVTTSDSSGRVVSTHDVSDKLDQLMHQKRTSLFMSKAQRRHIANCKACQKSPKEGTISRVWSKISRKRKISEVSQIEAGVRPSGEGHDSDSINKTVPHALLDGATEKENARSASSADQHIATVSIVGMTCASCTNAITTELLQVDFIQDVQVNLLSNNATIKFSGKGSDASKIVDAIEDVGFEASIDNVESDHQPPADSRVQAKLSIEGMTCGSCVAAVTRGIEQAEGLISVNVDLLGNSATVVLQDKAQIDKVLEAIEDVGFEGSLVEFLEEESTEKGTAQFRTVEFEITGMYCSACPQNILNKLRQSFSTEIEMLSEPSLKQPRLTIRYKPTSTLNVRRLKYTIESADPVIVASIYHPPSMEERSHAVHRKESGRILRHLLFTLVAAIPSFVIGIVFMSLVPEDDPTRLWFEEPMWAGDAMRMDWAMFILTTPVMFYGANIFHTRALKEIWSLWRPKSKVPLVRRVYRFGSMNLLISAGTSVAYFSSLAILIMAATKHTNRDEMHSGMGTRHSITYFDTVTFLTLFILCGKYLQAYSKSRTGDAVAMLGKLRPSEALLIDSEANAWEEGHKPSQRSVPIDLLEIGDIVSIPHGASPPTDGIVDQEGSFLFDESSLTGESRPVKKVRGDTILTGSVNVSDPVRIQVKELGGKSMLDQIIAVVRGGQAKRAPVERFADIATSYFTPIITLIAISTWVIWLALGQSGVLPRDWLDVDQGGWPFWSVEFAIAVFVVACPCGLGLAAPTALFVGGGLAAKAGILVQGGGEAFQEASQLDAIVFDKTGTLTEGQMRVTDMLMLDEKDQDDKFQLAMHITRALEESSTHPIAKAIAKYCIDKMLAQGGQNVDVLNVGEEPGRGMRGTFRINDITYEATIGNERQLVAPASSYLASSLSRFQSTGCSTAILSIRNHQEGTFMPTAVFAISDPIRAEAPSVLHALRSQNVAVHMCTGDNEVTARAIASQLDIPVSNIRAGVLPQDKAQYIQELQQSSSEGKRKIIGFVGDGTNDTPALTAADVSIALSSGSDIALTSSSFILLNSNLTTILHLVRLAKRVFFRVKLNFAWAAVYNVSLIPVAAGVFFPIAQWRLSPVWAAAAMAGSSVSVVLSSLALRLPEVTFRRTRSASQEATT
ncbi:hypothetical protein PMZ80_007558 [Knufia obscura]|uniref:HMA domain-containing protein n=2 Tax=Knufia TaxID=430999 RepID=A0AAN8EF13_9EURO|nr:hypothetical protein PMZ80_007558 [Knufia obscura]KAK5954099.1 hypothetical protein OHC33_004671 [Knufia fluminis]